MIFSRALISAFLLAAAPALAAEPYELHGVLSLTGGGAFLGAQEYRTLQAIESVVNGKGGIKGRPIHFAIEDDTTSPVVAVQLATDIIAKHVPIMLGPTLVASCSAVGPLFKDGPVQYCFAPGIYPPPGAFVFSAGVSTRDYVIAALRYFRDKGWTRVALIASTDATGQEGERIVNAGMALPENKSLTMVATAHFNITDVSAAAQMSRIKGEDPNVVIAWTTGAPFGTVLHGYADAGMSVPLYTNAGNIARKQMDQYAAFAPKELLFASSRYLAYKSTDPAGDPVTDAQRLYYTSLARIGLTPDVGTSIAWDTGRIVLKLFELAGFDASAAKLHATLEQLHDFAGINGVFDFRDGSQRGLGLSSSIVVRWDAAQKNWFPVAAPGGKAID